MAKTRFSNTTIDKLKPGEYTDQRYPNLVLRIGKNRRTWMLRLRRIGGRKGIRPGNKLGYYPELDTEAAVLLYHQETARLARGEPAQDHQQQIKELERQLEALRKAGGQELLFLDLTEKFLKKYVPRKSGRPLAASTRDRYRQVLTGTVMKPFHNCDAGQIGHKELRTVLEDLHQELPGAAIKLYKVLKTMYTWAFERELISNNPLARIQAPGKYADRDRFLAPEELAHAWRAFSDLSPTVGHVLKMIFLTGQRRNEVAHLPWREIAESGDWWYLEKERTKMKIQGNKIFLGPAARAILEAQRAVGSRRYVFPGQQPSAPVSGVYVSAACRAVSRQLLEEGKIRRRFTVHDARRTIGTNLVEMGLATYEEIQKILNHKTSVTDIYVRATYERQKEKVYGRWDELVHDVCGLKPGAF